MASSAYDPGAAGGGSYLPDDEAIRQAKLGAMQRSLDASSSAPYNPNGPSLDSGYVTGQQQMTPTGEASPVPPSGRMGGTQMFDPQDRLAAQQQANDFLAQFNAKAEGASSTSEARQGPLDAMQRALQASRDPETSGSLGPTPTTSGSLVTTSGSLGLVPPSIQEHPQGSLFATPVATPAAQPQPVPAPPPPPAPPAPAAQPPAPAALQPPAVPQPSPAPSRGSASTPQYPVQGGSPTSTIPPAWTDPNGTRMVWDVAHGVYVPLDASGNPPPGFTNIAPGQLGTGNGASGNGPLAGATPGTGAPGTGGRTDLSAASIIEPITNQNPNPAGPGSTGGTNAPGGPAGAPGADTAAGTAVGGTAGLQGLTTSITNQIQQIQSGLTSPGTPIDAQAIFLRQAQSIISMLNDQEAQLRSDAQKQGTQVDPATQFTIDQLKQTLQDNLVKVRDQLNHRGLYDSGIELELENRLQKGSASDQAQILGKRLEQIQAQLNSGLTAIRSERFQALDRFGLAGAQAQTSQDQLAQKLGQDREQQALQAMLALRGQQSAEERAQAAIDAQNQRQQAQYAFQGQQAGLQRAFQTQQAQNAAVAAAQRQAAQLQAQANLARQAQDAAARQGDLNRAAELQRTQASAQAAADRAAAAAQAAAARLQQQQAFDLQTRGYRGGLSVTNTDSALADLVNNYTDVGDALAAIQRNAPQLQQNGVDIGYLENEAIKRLSTASSGSPNLQ